MRHPPVVASFSNSWHSCRPPGPATNRSAASAASALPEGAPGLQVAACSCASGPPLLLLLLLPPLLPLALCRCLPLPAAAAGAGAAAGAVAALLPAAFCWSSIHRRQ